MLWPLLLVAAVQCLSLNGAALKENVAESLRLYTPLSEYFSLPKQRAEVLGSDFEVGALNFLARELRVPQSDLLVKSQTNSVSKRLRHVHLVQLVDGIEVENAVAGVNLMDGRVVSWSHSMLLDQSELQKQTLPRLRRRKWYSGGHPRSTKGNLRTGGFNADSESSPPHFKRKLGSVTASEAMGILLKALRSGSEAPLHVSHEPRLKYLRLADETLELVYSICVLQMPNWYNGFVSATTGRVVALANWAHQSSYRVVDSPKSDPTEGFTLVKNPSHYLGSPLGWHQVQPGKPTYSTFGNNVLALENQVADIPFSSVKLEHMAQSPTLTFDFSFNERGSLKENRKAAITNLFYWCNRMHDISYVYGFNEESGNFQGNNFGRGGKGEDQTFCLLHDGQASNSAFFLSPPDGSNGIMSIARFHSEHGVRDASFDNDLIQHEYMHGITSRLVGGPENPNCMQARTAQALAEGYSDFMAIILRLRASDSRFTPIAIGKYVAWNALKGIRTRPYTSDLRLNFLTFRDLSTRSEVHDMGEIWAATLHDVLWNLITRHGIEKDIFSVQSKAGNIRTMHLIMVSLKLLPCNPTFIQARDALLQANEFLYGGESSCVIWKGFARRGLGQRAVEASGQNWDDDYSFPKFCY